MRILIWPITLIISLVILFIGILDLYKNASLLLSGQKTSAIVSVDNNDKKFVVFSDKYGSSHIKPVDHFLEFTLRDKQQVYILYNAKNTGQLVVNSFIFMWIKGLIILFISLVGITFSFLKIDIKVLSDFLTGSNENLGPDSNLKNDNLLNQVNKKDTNTNQKVTSNFDSSSISYFGLIKPLIEDTGVADIILAGPNDIFIKKGNKIVKTNISFSNESKYDELVDHLLITSDNSLSISRPIIDGMLTPNIRIHAVHKVLCESYHYVTLRISRFDKVKFIDIAKNQLAPRDILNYLRAILLTGNTILVAGEVGTGKTTLLRGLASTISQEESILVIEDTPEIKVEHPVVRYVRTRLSNTEGVGKVTSAECIKAGLRMAMNRIIFGEIRDPEAAESFIDVCVSGHPGMSTIHARSASDAISRLELLLARQQPGVERFALKEQIAAAVQVIAYTQICKVSGKRRITEVVELRPGGKDPIECQYIFKYSISGDMPVWKVENRNSFFKNSLKEFEGGYHLENLPDWISLT